MPVHRIHAPNPCLEFMHLTTRTISAIMRYMKSLTPSTTVAKQIKLVKLQSLYYYYDYSLTGLL